MSRHRERSYWPNRHLCDVLEDMRKITKTHKDWLPPVFFALIEEAQVMGNRMEAGLGDKKDLIAMQDEWHQMRKKIKKLRTKVKEAKKKK